MSWITTAFLLSALVITNDLSVVSILSAWCSSLVRLSDAVVTGEFLCFHASLSLSHPKVFYQTLLGHLVWGLVLSVE